MIEPIGPAAPFRGPTLMTQSWRDAGFLHWAVEPRAVAGMLPPGVGPDVVDDVTWVGLVPFRMVDAGVGAGPAVPFLGTFLETNVRLYTVDDTGKRGIVFRSLDASRAAVVAGARVTFGLPYRRARMAFRAEGGEVLYRAATRDGTARSVVRLRPGEPLAGPDPLADFLTLRWALHERHAGTTWYVPNVHGPWPLHRAEVTALDDELVAAAGFPQLAGRPPDHVLYSPGVDVRFGFPRPTSRGR